MDWLRKINMICILTIFYFHLALMESEIIQSDSIRQWVFSCFLLMIICAKAYWEKKEKLKNENENK